MKTCFKCGIAKERGEFYRHAQMADGLLGKCKACTKSDAHKHREDNLEKVKQYDRNRPNAEQRNLANIARMAKLKIEDYPKWLEQTKAKLYRNKNPEKYAAHTAVGNALRELKLTPECCYQCQHEKAQAHHEDYSKQLEVIWLCVKCHLAHHKRERDYNRKAA